MGSSSAHGLRGGSGNLLCRCDAHDQPDVPNVSGAGRFYGATARLGDHGGHAAPDPVRRSADAVRHARDRRRLRDARPGRDQPHAPAVRDRLGAHRRRRRCRARRGRRRDAVCDATALQEGRGDGAAAGALVAPMSGHFATLLRATVRTMLPEHDVYITDWHNARDVSRRRRKVRDRRLRRSPDPLLSRRSAPARHVVAVCQPCVPVLEAVAIMAEAGNPAQPRSMTLMAGPIDARVNPTLGERTRHEPFDRVVRTPRDRHGAGALRGATRRVYPGFCNCSAFVSMNFERHVEGALGHVRRSRHRRGRRRPAAIAAFYDEYFAVADLPAEFYLETVKSIVSRLRLWRAARSTGTVGASTPRRSNTPRC